MLASGALACLVGGTSCAVELEPVSTHELEIHEVWTLNCNYDSEEKQGRPSNVIDDHDEQPCGDSVATARAGLSDGFHVDTLLDIDINEPDQNLRTGVRVCPCVAVEMDDTPAVRTACELLAAGDCDLDFTFDYDRAEPFVWNRPTILLWKVNEDPFPSCCDGDYSLCCDPGFPNRCDGPDPAPCCAVECVPDNIPADYEEPLGRWGAEVELTWDVSTDSAAWGAREATPDGWRMPAVGWTHTPGPTGAADFPVSNPDWDVPQRRLTSHYLSANFGFELLGPESDYPGDDGFVGPLIREDDCIVCDQAFPEPPLSFPSCVGLPGCPDPEVRFPEGVKVATPFFTAGALTGLGSIPGAFLDAAEPHPFLPSDTGARFAKVATNGTAVHTYFVQTASGLSRTDPTQGGTPPPARSSFGVVLSHEQNRVFVIGGLDGLGIPYKDMYGFSLSAHTWTRYTFSGTVKPERVLAATYSSLDDRLVVLDKVGTSTIRLLRFGTTGGAVTVLASWPVTNPSISKYALAVEPWGQAYVAACSGTSGGHTMLRMTVGTAAQVTEYGQSTGVLAGSILRTTYRGSTVYVPAGLTDPTAVGYETADLLPAGPGTPGLCF